MRFTAVLVAALWGCHPAALPMMTGPVAAAVPVGTTPSTTPLCESIEAQCTGGGGTGSPWIALAVIAAVPAVVLLVTALTHER